MWNINSESVLPWMLSKYSSATSMISGRRNFSISSISPL